MIRLAGILTGSAIAAVLLIAVLGLPRLRLAEPAADTSPPIVPQTQTPLVTNLHPILEAAPEATADSAPLPAAAAPAQPRPDNEPEPEPEPEPDTVIEEIIVPVERLASEQTTAEQRWYAFWSPFRSQFAADGFVSQLQRTTGLDYRVVKLKPGVYEVAFAYSDDADIEDKLMQISSATGLELSGG